MTHDSLLSRRERKLIERASVALGEPVAAAGAFRVEGTLPWYFAGILVGLGLLQGVLGALIGLGLGALVARLATRHRARGFGFTTIIAVTATQLHAIKASFWTGRPVADGRIGSWPLAAITMGVRYKRLTTAVSLELPDGRHVRLEGVSRKHAAALVGRLRATPG